MGDTSITLSEWQERLPESGTSLAGVYLDADANTHRASEQLRRSGKLVVTELRAGIAITSFSHVGRVRLGSLVITVQPKLSAAPLLSLLRYAYGLRDIELFQSAVQYDATVDSFQDLLIHQLLQETADLIARGLHRTYRRVEQVLQNPRGKIDIHALSRQMKIGQAALPCIDYPRLENNPLNQVLAAGLCLAATLTDDLQLRSGLRQLTRQLELLVSHVELTHVAWRKAQHSISRLTVAYQPAMQIIQILANASGINLENDEPRAQLPGFLFDMNLFFQTLLSRFLGEYLESYKVQDQYRLHSLMSYVPGKNPRHRQAPEPRPDFVVLGGSRIVAILDAKYRDLWETSLPREMLYQLAIYALSQGAGSKAVILYPTISTDAQEAAIEIHDPLYGADRAYVILRPVNLLQLETVTAKKHESECHMLAHNLVFGC